MNDDDMDDQNNCIQVTLTRVRKEMFVDIEEKICFDVLVTIAWVWYFNK